MKIINYKLIALYLALTLIASGIGVLFNVSLNTAPVLAAGDSEVTIYPLDDAAYWYNGLWTEITDAANPNFSSQGSAATISGGAGWGTQYNQHAISWSLITFDVGSALPEGAEIKSILLKIYISAAGSTGTYPWLYYGIYSGYPANPALLAQSDGRKWWYGNPDKKLVGDLKNWSELEAGYYNDFIIQDVDYVKDDSDGKVAFYVLNANQYYKMAPGWQSGLYTNSFAYWNRYNTDYKQKLIVTYTESAPPVIFEHDDNAAKETEVYGDEKINGIDIGTPKCLYDSDNGIWFTVNGTSGAKFTGAFVSESGDIVETVDDEVRTDDNYDWWITGLDELSGFYRAWAITDNDTVKYYSPWISIAPEPSSSERTNDIYSKYTEYTQYEREFSEYIVQEYDLLYVHWKTNIDGDTELGDYDLELLRNGQVGEKCFDLNLYGMWENYYKGTEANAKASLYWRYAIFRMQGSRYGQSIYGGLIIDLDKELSAGNKGFYQPVIRDNGDESLLTETQSSYWYLENVNEGLVMSLRADVNDIVVSVNVGPACRVSQYLPDFTILIIGEKNYGGGTTVINGVNDVRFPDVDAGVYVVRYKFSGSQVSGFDYIHDIDMTVVESGEIEDGEDGDGIIDDIDDWLEDLGLDNAGGHWLALLLGMIALFLLAYKSEVLRVAFPLCLFAAALVFRWVDWWYVVILALGAGVFIWSAFRKRVAGGREE